MPWPTRVLGDWKEFVQYAARFSFGNPFQFSHLFRGQANAAHSLSSSLNRLLPAGIEEEAALGIEAAILREFKTQARNVVPQPLLPDEESPVEWWGLMQHHGVPTRLLDWSASPYVAAYFAVVNSWDKDGAIWVIYPHAVMQTHGRHDIAPNDNLDQIAVKAGGPHVVSAALASRRTERMIAQQGHFTFALNILCDQESAMGSLDAEYDASQRHFEKLIVPRDQKAEYLHQLRGMNVSANALFP